MKTGTIILIGAGAIAAYTLYDSGTKLMNLEPSFKSVAVDKAKSGLKSGNIVLKLVLNVYNPNERPVKFKKLVADIFYKGSRISAIDPLTSESIVFEPRKESPLALKLSVPQLSLVSEFAAQVLNAIKPNSAPTSTKLTFVGTMYAEGLKIPFNQEIDLKTI
jgi:LEA14-like dessication related protein